MEVNQYTIGLEQIDRLSVSDARLLCDVLMNACNAAGTDGLPDLLFPLLSLAERSLLGRPVKDIETLATKVRIACSPVYEGEPDMMALWKDVEAILRVT